MDILIQSDLHLDYNKRKTDDIEDRYIQYMTKRKEEFLVIVGDIAGSASRTRRILKRLKEEANKKVYFVLGNHDIYDSKDSKIPFRKLKEDESILVNRSVELSEDVVLIGGFSWYDYSFKPTYMNEEEVAMHKKNLWSDARYALWGETDKELHDRMIKEIAEEFEKNKNKRVIFANHFLPYEDFLTFKQDQQWNLCNAFMGSKELGEMIDQYKNIEYVTFGHTHRRFGVVEVDNKKIVCNPFGYYMEWKTNDFEKEIEKATITIEM